MHTSIKSFPNDFFYSVLGYVHASLEYLKKLVPNLKPGHEMACLAFDEMKVVRLKNWSRPNRLIYGLIGQYFFRFSQISQV